MEESRNISFEKKLRDFVRNKKFQELLRFLQLKKNKKIINEDAMNIISVICLALKENEEILKDISHFIHCSESLIFIANNGNAKEVLIGLLEGADSFKSTEFFQLLLEPIQTVLLLIPGKRGKSLDWVLGILNAHILSLPLQENYKLEDKELLVLDLDLNVRKISQALTSYVEFLKPFFDEVSHNSLKLSCYPDRIQSQREILQKYILQLFARPLAYQDLHYEKNLSCLHVTCLKMLKYLADTSNNFFNFPKTLPVCMQSRLSEKMEQFDKVPVLVFGNLAYLMFVEQHCSHCRPYVYSHVYLLEYHTDYMIHLLEKHRNLVLYKGLHLSRVLLGNCPEFSLPGENLGFDKYVELSKAFLNVAAYSDSEKHRILSTTLFSLLVLKFSWESRYVLMMTMLNLNPIDMIQGFIIGVFKNCIHLELKSANKQELVFKNLLPSFIRKVLHLEQGLETDILEDFHKIMNGLNFFLYLVLRDKKIINETGIWNFVDDLAIHYIEPLHKGIELSRAHYAMEHNLLKEEQKNKSTVKNTTTENGKLMPNVPPSYKSSMIIHAMNSLDIVEDVLSRLKQVLGQIY